jgi:hypothetical protein
MALPDVATAARALAVAVDMTAQQPLHPVPKAIIGRRPEDQVQVVGHQTVANNAHGHAATSLADEAGEAVVVVLVVEGAGAAMAAVPSMVAISSGGSSCSAGHEESFRPGRPVGKEISMVGADTGMGSKRGGRKEP